MLNKPLVVAVEEGAEQQYKNPVCRCHGTLLKHSDSIKVPVVSQDENILLDCRTMKISSSLYY